MSVVVALLPFVSVALGGFITYWVNVRQARRGRVDEVFHRAIGAVAIVNASRTFITDLPPMPGASRDEHAAFMRELHKDQYRTYVSAVAAARSAVAEASAHDAKLAEHLDKPDPFERHGAEITERLLKTGQRLEVKELSVSMMGTSVTLGPR